MVPWLGLELGYHGPPSIPVIDIDWDRWLAQEDSILDSGIIDSVESVKNLVPLNLQLQLMGFTANDRFRLPDSRLIDAPWMLALAQLLSPPRMPPLWISEYDRLASEDALLARGHHIWETRREFADLDNLRLRTAMNMAEIQVWLTAFIETLSLRKMKFFNFSPVFDAPLQTPDFARITKWTGAEWSIQDPVLFEESSFCYKRENVQVRRNPLFCMEK